MILIVGWLFTTVFAGRLFQAALISQVYRIQNYFEDFTQYYMTKEEGKLTSESNNSSLESSSNSSSSSNDIKIQKKHKIKFRSKSLAAADLPQLDQLDLLPRITIDGLEAEQQLSENKLNSSN